MPDQPVIAIFAQTQPVRAYLSDMVKASGCEIIIVEGTPAPQAALVLAAAKDFSDIPRAERQKTLWLTGGNTGMDTIEEGVRLLKPPLRAALIAEAIGRMLAVQGAIPARVAIGGYEVDTRENLWMAPEDSPVRLTEKEVAILLFLKESSPKSVTKQALLEKVWAYADGVETHTLETHIYRLRQKIEADPSAPKILLTEEDGYKISGD